MARIQPFRKGDTAEYLAQVFLSALSFSNPIYRQEDYGIDFSCSLIEVVKEKSKKREVKKLFPNESFNIQVKTGKKLEVEYKNESDNLKWLFKSKTPIFLCHLDDETKIIYFFSISQIHYITARKIKKYDKLKLKYNLKPKKNELNKANHYKFEINGESLNIDLGKPFMSISLNELKPKIIEEKKKILKKVISIEQENIIYRSLNLPLMRWLWKYETNNINTFEFGWNHLCDKNEDEEINNPNDVLKNIGQFLLTLAKSYELHKNDNKNGDNYIKQHNRLRRLIADLPFKDDEMDENKFQYNKFLPDLGFTDENGNMKPDIKKDID